MKQAQGLTHRPAPFLRSLGEAGNEQCCNSSEHSDLWSAVKGVSRIRTNPTRAHGGVSPLARYGFLLFGIVHEREAEAQDGLDPSCGRYGATSGFNAEKPRVSAGRSPLPR